MKNLFNLLLSFFAVTMVFVSCKKDENQILFEGGTDPVLTSSRTGTLPLSFATKDDQLMT
jgi:starch-binding outer membrane protein SusE/F